MQQTELISGFSELKKLLIRTYNIEQEPEYVKLYFSEFKNELLMHDYDDYKKFIRLCINLERKQLRKGLPHNARYLVIESLRHISPSKFLINEFQLYRFFKS